MNWLSLLLIPLVVARQPNIVVFVADDLGWNDLSFHGSDQIPTPNIDALAYSGIILNRHYVQPLCTPTRAAFMTSKYPIRLGMQGPPLLVGDMRALPKGKILPEYLREKGYSTHCIGKWHLGFNEANMTPTYRGFDSHFGYWNGYINYFDHDVGAEDSPEIAIGTFGRDMRMNMTTSWDTRGRYATDLFTERAEEVIAEHDLRNPLFMYVAHLAVHAGLSGQPVEAPRETIARFAHIPNPGRRVYAAMVSKLDESVGRVVRALQDRNMLNDTFILFTSDNGAPTFGFFQNWGSNYPLRSMKSNLWEGGVRGISMVWGSMLKETGVVSSHLMHVTDWLPTFYAAAGGDPNDIQAPVDGVSHWEWFTGNASCPRSEVLVNINEIVNTSAYMIGRWKLVQGNQTEDNGYYGDSGEHSVILSTRRKELENSIAGQAITEALGASYLPNDKGIEKIRQEATIRCKGRNSTCNITNPSEYCLFDVMADPCELKDVASEKPHLVNQILARIERYREVLEPQTPISVDLNNANPRLWSGTWTPWVTCQRNPEISWCNTSPDSLNKTSS